MSAAFGSMSLEGFLAATAAKTPTPGGGAVASATAALAAALAQMVVAYSVGKKSLAPHEPLLREGLHKLERAREILMRLADEDAAAYGLVNELSRLSESDPRRAEEMPHAALAAIQIPMSVVAACVDLLRLFESLATTTNPMLRSDLAIAAILAEAAARASRWNIIVNLAGIPAEDQGAISDTLATMLSSAAALAARIEAACHHGRAP